MYSERNPIHLQSLSQESVQNSGNGNLQFKFSNRVRKFSGPFSVSERYENNVKVISSENKRNEDNTNICFKVPHTHPPSPVRKLLKVIPYFQVNFMSETEKLLSENESESDHHHHEHGVGVQEESEQSYIIEQKSNSKEERWMETQFLASIRDIGKSFSPNPFHNNVSCSPFLPLALASLCLVSKMRQDKVLVSSADQPLEKLN